MKNKILLTLFSLVFVFGVSSLAGVQTAHAQSFPNFPVGCTSNLGYSVTNGSPCNGTSIATMNILGCVNALNYSISSGIPCDGASVAIPYLAGCSSIYGFSTISGAACNGNTFAQLYPDTTTPGLPTTGAGANALVNMMLLLSGTVVLVGSAYFVKKYTTAV